MPSTKMWQRRLCSIPPARELRQHLHRLYQRVHPDRFAQNPHAHDVNQRSFQTLQAALDHHFSANRASSGGPDPTATRTSLTFFAHADTSSRELRRAQVELSPGARSLATALLQLFAQLGLDPPPAHVLAPPKPAPMKEEAFRSVIALAQYARRHAARNASRKQQAAAEAAVAAAEARGADAKVLLFALQRAHGVHIDVDGAVPEDARRVALLGRLRDALRDASYGMGRSSVTSPLSAANIYLTAGFEAGWVTRDGFLPPYIELGACSKREQWDTVLCNPELRDACLQLRERRVRLRELEDAAAQTLRVRLVLHHLSDDALCEYADLLGELQNEKYSENLKNIALMVVPGEEIGSDDESGVLRVGVALGAVRVKKSLSELGPSVAVNHGRFVEEKGKREKEIKYAARALRLSALTIDEAVTNDQWTACATAMRQHAHKLSKVLDGADVHVVDGEAEVSEVGLIRLPWNFATNLKM